MTPAHVDGSANNVFEEKLRAAGIGGVAGDVIDEEGNGDGMATPKVNHSNQFEFDGGNANGNGNTARQQSSGFSEISRAPTIAVTGPAEEDSVSKSRPGYVATPSTAHLPVSETAPGPPAGAKVFDHPPSTPEREEVRELMEKTHLN